MKECWVCLREINCFSENQPTDWYRLESHDTELDSGYRVRYFCCFYCLKEWVTNGLD